MPDSLYVCVLDFLKSILSSGIVVPTVTLCVQAFSTKMLIDL